MRVKTSVSLSEEVLSKVAEITSEGERSEFVEKALWSYVARIQRQRRNADDLKKINESSEFLNAEATDILSYQVDV